LDNQKQLESALPLTIMLVYKTVVDHAMPVASLNPGWVWRKQPSLSLELRGGAELD